MENPLIPINEDITEIENNLYIGNLETACNAELIQRYRIKKILSVLQMKIPKKYEIQGIDYKYINIWDTENEDIISYFPECCDYIESAQLNGEGVFVHCRAGRSRSASIIIAFMMKKYDQSLEKTIKAITVLRNEVSPNTGFQYQLKLWQKMGFLLLGSHREYRLVLVGGVKSRLLVINKFGHTEIWSTCAEALTIAFTCYLQKVINAENLCQSLNRGKPFFCKSCWNQLFEEINLIQNTETLPKCGSLYIEPQKWILSEMLSNAKSMTDVLKGEIKCFECKELLGTYDWHSSTNSCNCEAHIRLNYYMVIKIDSNKLNQ